MLVDAGAGSGKTHALVGRLVALVDNRTDIGSIAVLTFTEKAAGELRERLRGALTETCCVPENRIGLRNQALNRRRTAA